MKEKDVMGFALIFFGIILFIANLYLMASVLVVFGIASFSTKK